MFIADKKRKFDLINNPILEDNKNGTLIFFNTPTGTGKILNLNLNHLVSWGKMIY